jgi:hypothetical protein
MNQIPTLKQNGGKRPGSGRKKGVVSLERLAQLKEVEVQKIETTEVLKQYTQRANRIAHKLFESKVVEAVGYHKMVRIEVKTNKKTKSKHVKELYTVTNPEEFDSLLENGVVGVDYLLVVASGPNYKALESLENRAWGKPTETIQHEGSDGGPLRIIIDR